MKLVPPISVKPKTAILWFFGLSQYMLLDCSVLGFENMLNQKLKIVLCRKVLSRTCIVPLSIVLIDNITCNLVIQMNYFPFPNHYSVYMNTISLPEDAGSTIFQKASNSLWSYMVWKPRRLKFGNYFSFYLSACQYVCQYIHILQLSSITLIVVLPLSATHIRQLTASIQDILSTDVHSHSPLSAGWFVSPLQILSNLECQWVAY